MWIMISGPYRTNTRSRSEQDANLRSMNDAAYEVFLRGHTPIIGVNLALPVIDAANASDGRTHYDEIMMPLSLEVARRCDAVFRVGGPSHGADDEVRIFQSAGKPVFRSLDAIPRLHA